MGAHLRGSTAVAVLAVLVGCDAVDRARSTVMGGADSVVVVSGAGSGLALSLQSPGMLRPGEEGVLRLSLTNNTDTLVSQARLELLVPGWAEPVPPRPGDPEVTMAALAEGGTRFAYRMDASPLSPSQTLAIEQRIRVPAAAVTNQGAVPWGRTVQARLLDVDGRTLSEVFSDINLDSIPGAGDSASSGGARSRDQLGPIRLGIVSADVRRAVPAAQDTSWSQEGMRQQGLAVPIGANGRALVVLAADSVVRIEVSDSVVTTAEGLRVGSTFGQLKAAYGPACAEAAEGRVVVWFAGAPGISFALDMAVPQNVAALRSDPDSIPADTRVARWWLRRGVVGCPR